MRFVCYFPISWCWHLYACIHNALIISLFCYNKRSGFLLVEYFITFGQFRLISTKVLSWIGEKGDNYIVSVCVLVRFLFQMETGGGVEENNFPKMNISTETDSTLKERVNDILDSLNALPEGDDIRVNRIDIVFTTISIGSRVMSIISTLLLALFYYHNNKIDHFTWTLCCFIIPMFVTMFLQLSM